MDKTSNKHLVVLIYVALALTTIAVFWQVRNYDFVNYDDLDYITENQHVQAGLARDSIIWAFTTGHASNWHPLTWLSHMLDCQLFGTNAGWHHLTNLLLHIANTLLLFAVLKQMTAALWRSAFVAAAFALHPLHVESVAWISERKDVLSTLFWMLTMAAYLRYVKRPGVSWYLLALLFFALGLMAKPMLITLPFVLLLLDYWPLHRFQLGKTVKNGGRRKRKSVNTRSQWRVSYRLIREKVPFFILSAISSVVTFLVQQSGGAVAEISVFPLNIRITNAFISYLTYIEKMFWPSRLAMFYPHPGYKSSMWYALLAALLLLGISIWVIRLARKRRYLAVGWLWYLGTLIPVIGLVQVGEQALADRYTYIPLTGLFIIIAWGLGDLLAKWRYRKTVLGVSAMGVLLTLSICTNLQQRYWRNSTTLSEHALEVTDGNHVAHLCLADPLYKQGRLDDAVKHYTEALRVLYNYPRAHIGMARVLFAQGKLDGAIKHYNEALQIQPDSVEVLKNLGNAFYQQGKLKEAVREYQQVLQMLPDNPDAHNDLGVAIARQGKLNEAITHFTEALRIKPDFADAHSNLGHALANQGKLDEAVTHLEEAVQLDPNSSSAHYQLARASAKKGKISEAITHLKETLRLRPDWVDPMNNLAWLLATHEETRFRNPKEAVRLAERACELTDYENPALLDTLAAAYAAAGKFPRAIETAEKALQLAQSSGQNELMSEIQNRLRLYKAGQPYIEH